MASDVESNIVSAFQWLNQSMSSMPSIDWLDTSMHENLSDKLLIINFLALKLSGFACVLIPFRLKKCIILFFLSRRAL